MGRAEIKLFQRDAESVAEFLRPRLTGEKHVKIITHTDADGISAAAIIARCLYFYDVPFNVHFTRPKKAEEIAKLAEEGYDLFIFLDQGSGQAEAIHKFLVAKNKDVIIIDHHPGNLQKHPNLVYLNPHTCGLNGAKDVSASGGAYLVAERLDLRFRYLVGLALIGAIGDRQEFFSGFTEVNDLIAKRAIDLEIVRQGEGLRLIGRSMKPVFESLQKSTRPFIVGLSRDPSACRLLLKELGISQTITISEFHPEDEKNLADAIFSRVGPVAEREEFRHALWGTVYTNASDQIVGPRDLREYATVLDACANFKKSDVALAMATGDDSFVKEAMDLLNLRQDEMLKSVDWLIKKSSLMKDAGNFRYIYCGDEIDPSLIGESISLLIESGTVDMDKPLLGLVDTPTGNVKVSGRGTPRLAMDGVDVGGALNAASAEVGGFGGGHDVAAAARIPAEKMNEFLNKLNEFFARKKDGL